MKLAIVHDDLIQFGGAERILLALHKIWPDAPIYTSVVSKKWQKVCRDLKIDLRVSFMQYLPFAAKLNRYYSPFLLHTLAFENFDFSEYDVVVSVSTRYAHGIIVRPGTIHICYMNSPGRMFWESSDYFSSESFGLLSPLKNLAKPFLSLPLSHLREWDYIAAQKVDFFIANSHTPQLRIQKYYQRDSAVVYPFVEYAKFSEISPEIGDYFVVLTRLVPWKRVDIAVQACSELDLPLKVVGEGPDLERLKKLAGPSIEFLGYITEKKKASLLASCRAVIVTQKEDFGIVPLEAMAAGKPVIAYAKGGALETVVEGSTGTFFYEQTSDALKKELETFDPARFDPYKCRDQAKKFDVSVFERRIEGFVSRKFSENSSGNPV